MRKDQGVLDAAYVLCRCHIAEPGTVALRRLLGALLLATSLAFPRGSVALEGWRFLGEQRLGLEYPAAIARLGEQGFVVFDRGSRLLAWFDPDFKQTAKVSFREDLGLKIRDLGGLTFSPELKRVFALDPRGRQLLVFDAAGKHERTIALGIERAGEISEAVAMAVDPNGRVYIADAGAGHIKVFTLQGLFLFAIARPPDAEGRAIPLRPSCLAVQSDGTVAALEMGERGLLLFSRTGEMLGRVGLEGQYRDLKGLTLTRSGQYLSFDGRERKIYKWEPSGRLNALFGVRGTGRGEFDELADIVPDAAGNIVALDSGSGTVKKLGSQSPILPASTPPCPSFDVSFLQSEPLDLQPVAVLTNGVVLFDAARNQVHVRRDGSDMVVRHADFKRVTAAYIGADDLFLFDASRCKVFVFRVSDQSFAFEFGRSGSGEGCLDEVSRIMPGPKSTVYLADPGATRVHIFSKDGIFCTRFGTRGRALPEEIGHLADIAWYHGHLAVLDSGRKLIHLFDPDGRFERNIEIRVPQQDPDMAWLGVDPRGLLLALDQEHCRMFVLKENGCSVFSFGSDGSREFDMHSPGSFLTDGSGRLRILDGGDTSRVLTYALRTADPLALIEEGVADAARSAAGWESVKEQLGPYLARIGAGHSSDQEYARLVRIAVTANVGSGGRILSAPQLQAAHGFLSEWLKTQCGDAAVRVALATSLRCGGRTEEAIAVLDARPSDRPDPKCEALQKSYAQELAASGRARANVTVVKCEIPDLFAALAQSYYDEPTIRLTLRNSGGEPSAPGKALFFARAVMDNPTETEIAPVAPFSSATTALRAALNRNVLTYVEAARLGAELEVRLGTSPSETVLKENQTFQLLGRNAADWKREGMIACFVTPKDPDVQVFARQALKEIGGHTIKGDVDEHLYRALALFDAMQTVGLYYQPDPRQPFNYSKLSGEGLLDYVQFPAETLRRQSGDCDDLCVLYAALLESSGIPTVLVTSPGHIFVAFALKKGKKCVDSLGVSPDLLIERDGEYYVPVETTLLNNPFVSAWRVAAGIVARYGPGKQIGFINLQDAWQKHKVASLPPQEKEVPLPSPSLLGDLLRRELDALNLKELEKRLAIFKQWLQHDPDNLDLKLFLARSYGEVGVFDLAKEYAEAARKQAPDRAAAFQVLGNLAYLQNDFGEAIRHYLEADRLQHSRAVQVNLALAYLKKGDLREARKSYGEARRLDSGTDDDYPELKQLLE